MTFDAVPESGPGADRTRAPSDWLARLRDQLLPTDAGVELDSRLLDRVIRVRLSPAAMRAADRLTGPLTLEMELYFSCLVKKSVHFTPGNGREDLPAGSKTPLTGNLILQFRSVTTQHCRVADVGARPPVETMPVVRPQAFVPRWLNIDFHNGTWLAEYGY